MKKFAIAFALLAAILGGSAAYYFSQSDRRFNKNIEKARILLKQRKYSAAREQFREAYESKGGYSPHVSEEVLSLEVGLMRQEGRLKEAIAETNMFLAGAGPGNQAGRLLLAELHFEARNFDSAFIVLNEMVALDPGSLVARTALARVRSAQGRFDLAEAQFRQILHHHPDTLPALLLLAENLEWQGRNAERRELLQKAIVKSPKHAGAHLSLVDAWLREGRTDSAQAVLEALGRVDSASQVQVAIRKSRILYMTGKFDEALGVLGSEPDSGAGSVHLRFEESLIHARKGDFGKSIEIYDRIARTNPANRTSARILGALLFLAQGKPAQALEALKEVDPGLEAPENLQYSIYALLALGQSDKAKLSLVNPTLSESMRNSLDDFIRLAPPEKRFLEEWALVQYFLAARLPSGTMHAATRLYRSYPDNHLAASTLAKLYLEYGRPDSAYSLLSRLERPTGDQRLVMARYLLASGQTKRAQDLLEKLRRSEPRLKGVNMLLGELYLKRGDAAKSAASYIAELENDSGNLVVLNNLVWQYGAVEKDLEKARPYLQRLEKGDLQNPRIFDTIGWIYALNGDLEKGGHFLRQAVSLLPDDPALLYHVAYVEGKLGRKQEARAHLEKALASRAEWSDQNDAASLLQSLQ